MFRNPQISARALSPFFRSLARMLEAGVEVRKALKTSSEHSADPRLTVCIRDVTQDIRKGDDLTTSFRHHQHRFPALVLDLVRVGEDTGSLPEVCSSLADYYEASVKRMREFRAQVAWPLIQLFAAILIIGLLIYILGIIGQSTPGQAPEDILGLGLVGTSGSIKWFTMTLGTIAALWFAYIFTSRTASGRMAVHPFLMMVPAVGYCMRAFAIARFSWCFALTQKAGMPLKPSIESSLKATANGAFVSSIPTIWQELADGETLTKSLAASRLFPQEYLHIVDTGEQSGTVPEMLDRMSQRFDEDAHRAMTWMTRLMAQVIWAAVACFIGFIVISFFMRYVAMLNEAMQ